MLSCGSVDELHVLECIILLSTHWRCLDIRYTVSSQYHRHFQQWHATRVVVASSLNSSSLVKFPKKIKKKAEGGEFNEVWQSEYIFVHNGDMSKEYRLRLHFHTKHGAKYANLSKKINKKSKN